MPFYCNDLIKSGSETFQPNFTLKVPKSLKSHIDSLKNIDKLIDKHAVEYYDDDKKQRIDNLFNKINLLFCITIATNPHC